MTIKSSLVKTALVTQGMINISDSNNLIDNGDFEDGDSGWIVTAGWTISVGMASCDGTAGSSISQVVI